MVVQGKATIDEYDLEEEGLATLASAQIPALGPKWCLIPVHSNKCCGVWGLYLIFASLCSTSSNIEGLSVDHASEFVSLTDLAVKSPFSSSLKNVFTIYKKKQLEIVNPSTITLIVLKPIFLLFFFYKYWQHQ